MLKISVMLLIVASLATIPALNTTSNSASAQFSSAAVLSSSMLVDIVGYLHIFGEVQNNSDDPASVKITATFYDSSNKVVGTAFAFADVESLRPNEISPFHIILLYEEQVDQVDSYKLTVSSTKEILLPAHLELAEGDTYPDIVNYFHAVGEVTNKGPETTDSVKIVGTFYDDNHVVIGTAFAYAEDDELKPGQTSPFHIIFLYNSVVLEIESTSFNVQSRDYSMISNEFPEPSDEVDDEEQVQPPAQDPTPQQPPAPTPPVEKTGTETMSIGTITFTDMQDSKVNEIKTGVMIILNTKVTNSNDKIQPFVLMMEVRDDAGVTLDIQIQKGTLNPDGQVDVGFSWQPEVEGPYQIRALAISSLKNPEPLSEIVQKTVEVVQQ